MIKKLAWLAAGITALVVLNTTQATAYPDRGSGSKCATGASGTVCAHVETDISSGHIRARAAADANSGKRITITWVQLEELTTERSTGQQSDTVPVYTHETATSTGAVVSRIAGPVMEQCDNRLAYFQWRAYIAYTTSLGGPYIILTDWYSGAC